MDVTFNCPKCDQELEVDSSGSGQQIPCPTCGEILTIPDPPVVPGNGPATATVSARAEPKLTNPIASSAAAKVSLHLKVPANKAPEMLISKPLAPLEVAAKETDKRMRVKTIKHTDCIEVGRDRFDEVVSDFLNKVGEPNIISITPLTYTHLDIGTQKLMTDFGVLIVFRG